MLSACGKYSFSQKPFARGGEGLVFAGKDKASGCRVAVKVLSKVPAGVPAEVAALQDIPAHPHIMPVPVVTKAGGCTALVSPLYEGDVHTIAERDGPLPEAVLRGVMHQLLQAVAHLHAHGWTHNDIKLENMFWTAQAHDGGLRIVLGDFGLAKQQTRFYGRAQGTELFMAPEVAAALNGAASPAGYDGMASDVWSCLIVGMMAATLTGVTVWNGCVYLPTSAEWEALSPAAQDFFRSSLMLCPEDRPSVAALLKHPWFTA